jgi:hypothetical protein
MQKSRQAIKRKNEAMKFFIVKSEKKQLAKFELIRKDMLVKKNTLQIRNLINELSFSLSDRDILLSLASRYSDYFSTSIAGWEVELDIANRILSKESNSVSLSYPFELVQYCFYYFLLPDEFKRTFFLLHGLPLSKNPKAVMNLLNSVKNNRYVIFKLGQELMDSFLFDQSHLSSSEKQQVNRIVEEWPIIDNPSAFIIQRSNVEL